MPLGFNTLSRVLLRLKYICNTGLQSRCPICQGPGFHEQGMHVGTIMQYREVVSHLCFFKINRTLGKNCVYSVCSYFVINC